MFSNPDLAALNGAVTGLLETHWEAAGRDALLGALTQIESVRHQLDALDHRLLAALRDRGVAFEVGMASVPALLVELLRVSPSEARARVAAADDLGPRRELTGALLSPLFPAAAEAQTAGKLSAAHARVITRTISALPDVVEKEHGAEVEATLVRYAHELDPAALATLARRITAHLDPDGTLAEERDHQRRRSLRLRRLRDGCGELTGHLTPSALATWRTVLDALSAPAPADDGGPDPRRADQRAHDALLDAGLRLLRAGDLPDCGGVPVTILATMTAEQLADPAGYATTGHGDLISVPELLKLASEAEVVPVVLADTGGVLAYGRGRRLASPGQRLALAARDGGCSFPGCGRPSSWCETHHVVSWLDGGATDLDNLTLVCGYHHREHERRGWRCRMVDGVPEWIPPPWLDPTQAPRRNRAHQLLPP